MKILWFTWKDKTHPLAGGAEVMNEELTKRLVKDGHEVILLVGGYKGCKKKEVIDGYRIIRLGNRYTLYITSFFFYLIQLKGWADIVIEEVNTVPFFTQLYVKEKRLLLIYQLSREVWFYQLFFPLNLIGYFIEPFYLRILNKSKTITESKSTKKDLQKYGFKSRNISIVPVGTDITPIKALSKIKKYSSFTVLSLGAIRSMKRTHHQLKAFEIAKKHIPELKMKIAGNIEGEYGKILFRKINNSPYKKDMEYLGKISNKKKMELMQKCHVILVTSVKEGWGLIVTEAASQGTPAIVYNVDGLRDSVIDNMTGFICDTNTPHDLALYIQKAFDDPKLYKKLQSGGVKLSKVLTFDNSYKKFKELIHKS